MTTITELIDRFERGTLSRRQLIQALSLLVATPRAGTAQTTSLHGTGIDHVSVLVSDMSRSAAFYQSIFGMTTISEDKPNQILRLGMKRTIVSLRHEPPAGTGTVDHFAITVENFNREAVTKELSSHGLTPQNNIQFGFHIKDPDGVVVQIV
jgi:catechol 2,3-dioxygenase-like lactoylglutathione lyase family enzyme